MERESFEDAATAAVMNELFVNIKVDREERPDVDAVYMDAVVALTGQGGWPMTVFLTPAGEPFFGGTYYPPEPRHGLPAFRQVLVAIAEAYRDAARGRRRSRPKRSSARSSAAPRCSRRTSRSPRTSERGRARAARAARPALGRLRPRAEVPAGVDARVPAPRAARSTSCAARSTGWRRAACTTSSAAASTATPSTSSWLVPHFEKMLYDNALLVPAYLHGWLVTGEERYRRVVEQTVDYVLRELRSRGGGFASAQDADTDGVEGLTFTWTPDEDRPRPSSCCRSSTGGRSSAVSSRRRARRGCSRSASSGRSRCATTRRSPPGTASCSPRSPKRGGGSSATTGSTPRASSPSSCSGRSPTASGCTEPGATASRREPGYLEDYANVAHGLYELHVATGDARWLARVAPARAARDRALRRRRERRLLPHPGRR